MSERYVRAQMGEITFSDEEWVTRRGKIFAVGHYDHPQPDQQFTFTDADADAVVTSFAPVHAETEHFFTDHKPSIFDGKIGQLERVWREGSDLLGEMRVPKFVDRVWGEAGRKVSLVFDPVTKMILRCGLVLKPRVPDAVMMSASDLEDDQAAREGEVALALSYAKFADRSRSGANETETKEQNMGETTEQKGATGADSTRAGEHPPVEFAAALEAMRAENARLKEEQRQTAAKMSDLQAERRVERAKAAVKDLVERQHRLPAALFAEAVAVLTHAYEDDESTPVKFAATEGGTQRNRADTLLHILEQLPVSPMFNENVPAHILRFSDEQSAEEKAKNPLTPEGAEAGAREWAARINQRNGRS